MAEPLPGSAVPCETNSMTNALYYGDNLEVLSEHIADASVDLIYLEESGQGSLL